MASERVLNEKKQVVSEIKDKVSNAKAYVLFDYRGLTDAESKELRRKLRDNDSDYKVYKNTLMTRAFNDLEVDLGDNLNGPSALALSNDEVAAVKVLSDFAKDHEALKIKVGVVDGKVSSKEELAKLASIPGRETLLTMLASSMLGVPRNLSIALDLYAKQKEEN